MLNVSNSEVEWLKKSYPDLTFDYGTPSIIKGLFKFDAIYDTLRVRDAYEIKITLSERSPSMLPVVKETGGRIKKAKEKHGKDSFADVHLYADDASCLCTYPEEKIKLPNGFNLKDFFEFLLIPHFYAQSQFEKTGRWIWGERSHGSLGHFESYLDFGNKNNPDLVKKYLEDLKKIPDSERFLRLLSRKDKIKGHVNCYCGSNKEFRKCHPEAFKGLWSLREDAWNMGIKLNDVIR